MALHGGIAACFGTHQLWAKLTRSSQDTAYRDIQALVEQALLVKDAGGGRSTSYSLAQ
ncbi:MAG TPA: hypothetical protein VM912_19620 [Terriglobales bacterium]|nr:hypothetical protein [Terriglobales bacterium]